MDVTYSDVARVLAGQKIDTDSTVDERLKVIPPSIVDEERLNVIPVSQPGMLAVPVSVGIGPQSSVVVDGSGVGVGV